MKTSIVERKVKKHTHEVDIYNSYEIYAVCRICHMHDWGVPEDYKEPNYMDILQKKIEHPLIKYYKEKYPKNPKVVEIDNWENANEKG